MATGICKLCKKEKELINRSHIISDFLHSDLYDENHKLRAFEAKELKKENPRISKPSSGSYEGGLLCNKCDNEIIGKNETYISKVLNNQFKCENKIDCKPNTNIYGLNFIDVSNLDYTKTKLFLLSLLFRAHISSRPEYDDVDLGRYTENIRTQLLNEEAAPDDEIEIVIFKLEDGAGFSNFIGQPRKHTFENTDTYSIIILGYLVLYYTEKNRISKQMTKQKLSEGGTINLIQIPRDRVAKFVLDYTGALG